MTTYPVKLLKDKDGTAFIPIVNSDSIITPEGDTLDDLLDEKQDTLISGTNLKTINNQSLLGSGNIDVSGGSGTPTDVRINNTSITSSGVANIITNSTYSSANNKIATMNDLSNFTNVEFETTHDNKDYLGLVGNVGYQVTLGVLNLDGDVGAGMIIDENGITLTNFADTSAIPITGDARFNDYVSFEDAVDTQGDLHVYGDFNVEGVTAFGDEVTFGDFVAMQDGASIADDLGIGGDLDVVYTITAGNAIIGTTGNDDVTITGLVEPTNDDDAATKKYVDDICGDIATLLGGI